MTISEGKVCKGGINRLSPVTKRPKPPLGRYLKEDGGGGTCGSCGSSLMYKRYFFFGKSPGCIHPECENYGRRDKTPELLEKAA